MKEENILIKADNLKKHFPITRGVIFSKQVGAVKAVDGVSFKIDYGETLGLVGESGCGKSTTGRLLIRMLEPSEGIVKFKGENLYEIDEKRLHNLRKNFSIVFQDPYGSLNPRMSVGDIIEEPLRVHTNFSKTRRREKAMELLETVGLSSTYYNRYPNEFSGGQRQRIGVARAISLNPEFIICDEPVSALDVSVQAQILNLLRRLQNEFNLTYLFIAHDLSVVKHISDRIAVMYLGKIVELAEGERLYENPVHPYTKSLLSAVSVADPTYDKERIILEGNVGSPINPPSGCSFHPRCIYAREKCSLAEPGLKQVEENHYVSCLLKKN